MLQASPYKVISPFLFHVKHAVWCKNGPRVCIYAPVHVYLYRDKGYFYLASCPCVGAHVDESVCAWKQDKMRTSGASAVAVVFVSRGNTSH